MNLDIRMPKLDGYEVARRISARESARSDPSWFRRSPAGARKRTGHAPKRLDFTGI